MRRIETFFIAGKPVGKICEDLNAGAVTFTPKAGNKHLARRKWKSVVSCQRAVLKSYQSESPPDKGRLSDPLARIHQHLTRKS